MRRSILILASLALSLSPPLDAQLITQPLSPIVHDDGSVSLVAKAPAADSVKAAIYLGDTFAMESGEDGLWRVDIGTLICGE